MKVNKHMSKSLFVTLFSMLIFFGASNASGQQKMFEPKKGSAERTVILNAIKAYDLARNEDLAGEIFDVTAIRVHGAWAFASVERSNLPEAGQSTHLAVMQKVGTTWKVAWSDLNDNEEVGASAVERLRKKNKTFSKVLADFAMNYLAG